MRKISSNVIRVKRILDKAYSINGTIEDGYNVTDILADLMHFCDYEGVDFAAALSSARMHHDAEKKGEL